MSDNRQSDGEKSKRAMNARSLANLTGGSRKGIPNKATRIAKQVIADAFESLGGTEALVEWAGSSDDNLRVFYGSIYTKLIPVQNELTGKDGGPIQTEQVETDAAAFRRRLLSAAHAGGTAGAHSVTEH